MIRVLIITNYIQKGLFYENPDYYRTYCHPYRIVYETKKIVPISMKKTPFSNEKGVTIL